MLSSDVARRAGVSRATVSYVLNRRADKTISEQTRERVLAAARELGYVPSAAATALGSGRSRIVLLRDSGRIPSRGQEVLQLGSLAGLLRDALAREVDSWGMTLVSCGSDASLTGVLGHVDPALVIAPAGLEEAEAEAVAAVGAALVDRDERGRPLADLVLGRMPRLQVQYLVAHGLRRPAYLSTRLPGLGALVASRREEVLAACERTGLPAPHEHAVGQLNEDAIAEFAGVLRGWVEAGTDAVVCFNDLHAGLAVAAARSAGLRVPDELAVIGADDEVLGRFLDPPLTTVAPDMVAFARYLAARARAVLDGTEPPDAPATLARVVERGTVPAPRVPASPTP
ncbi:LacI family DNA-binding transcriptional regulator [Actinomyces sp.]|uniref:LacI family DNA-binding transcriptional regulator n=1 Tax=Actinomyces sp. TaxID=29317 RepID=UPI0026DB4FCA|nr:LacI family DNA-binding transcriptional regulator [Actinomyces sp.]MDO4900508.1 LacI family DNA-binding transcriptional regulator [Actinomyces sp.]